MPAPGSWGGPIYCEPLLIEGLRGHGVAVDTEDFIYGETDVPPTVLERVVRVLKAARRLRRRLRTNKYDVVHLNTSFDRRSVMRDLVTLTALRSSGVPVHLKMHGSFASFLTNEGPFWRMLQRRVFTMAADIGVLSSDERESFLRAGCPESKLSAAKYPVSSSDFVKSDGFREKHGIAADTMILLFSARFIPAKGLLDAIKAFAMLSNEGREVVLFCLGDGPQCAEAEAMAQSKGIAGRVRFTGYIPESETADFHANADIFILPTYHDEGFPLVLLKSLAAGMPIVTTRIRAAADYMSEPENCLWTEPRDPRHLAHCIARIIDDVELRHSMAENNRSLAADFTAERVAAEYIELYRRLASKQRIG